MPNSITNFPSPQREFNWLRFLCQFTCVGLCLLVVGNVYWWTYKLYPEIGMAVYSQCNSPAPGWNGDLWGFKVWENPTFASRNISFNTRHNSSFRRILSSNLSVSQYKHLSSLDGKKQVVIVASHHKTGTYLGQKIFSRICAIMRWCCVFHVTKDSLVSVKHSMNTEPVDFIAHTQWAWNPEDLGVKNYRMIHFYRSPFSKILSGYRYHLDGVEGWSTVAQPYINSCEPPKRIQKSKLPFVSKDDVYHYCKSPHLCEACCRIEHEVRYSEHNKHEYQKAHGSQSISAGENVNSVYAYRSQREYEFLCKYLGPVNMSLQKSLQVAPIEEGIRIEAALDFYENLRMARIINHTFHDPRSLNIDLDFFMGNYEYSVRLMLAHINLKLSNSEIESLVSDLKFYDIDNSPIYRFSMANPLFNHINTNGDEKKQFVKSALKADSEISELYVPIVDLMNSVLTDPLSSVGAVNALNRVRSQGFTIPK